MVRQITRPVFLFSPSAEQGARAFAYPYGQERLECGALVEGHSSQVESLEEAHNAWMWLQRQLQFKTFLALKGTSSALGPW